MHALIAMWAGLVALAGCVEPVQTDSGGTPATVQLGEEVTCANPVSRSEAAFDRALLPGEVVAVEPVGDVGQYDGGGVAVDDFDGDGFLDLFLPNTGTDQLFRGQAGGTFANGDGNLPASAADNDRTTGASAADVDGDGDRDLFLADLGAGNEIWFNEGGTFRPVETGIEATRWHAVGGSFGDLDQDGDLDLFVVNHYEGPELETGLFTGEFPSSHPNELWRNEGDGTFSDVSEQLPPQLLGPAYTLASGWIDIDDDNVSELYTVNDFGPYTVPNQMLAFADGVGTALPADLGLDVAIFGMGLGVGDVNGDAVPDFAMTSWDELVLLESGEGGWYNSALARNFVPGADDHQVAWGTVLADLDNDGDLDAPVSFGQLLMPDEMRERLDSIALSNPEEQRDGLYIQQEDGTFSEQAAAWGVADAGSERGVLAVDFDRDGWLDLVKRDALGPSAVYHARCGENRWIEVGFISPIVGGWVDVESGDRSWRRWIGAGSEGFASGGPPEAHFGVGGLETVDVRVHWPGGGDSLFAGIPTNRRVVVSRGE